MADNQKKVYLTVKDFTVSQETFGLYRDDKLDMLITFPKPDSADLPKYYQSENYISHTDRRSNWFELVYQFIKSIALKNKVKYIEKHHPKKGKLLDIGAGTGDFLKQIQKSGWDVFGIEPSDQARSLAHKKGIVLERETTNMQSQSYDVITMWHVLEHVEDLDFQITELKRLLKPNGTLFIAVPNYRSFDAKYYRRFWAGFDVPRHLWHFSKKSIKILFGKKDFEIAEMIPMKFDAFYVSLLSEKYKTGMMNIFKAVYIGLKSNRKAKKRFQYSSIIYVLKNK